MKSTPRSGPARAARHRRVCRLVAATCLAQAAACSGGRYGTTLAADQLAVLAIEPDAFVERIDGEAVRNAFHAEPIELSLGRRTIRVRRRIEVPVGERPWPGTPEPYRLAVGTDGLGTAAYVSDGACALSFETRPGQRYVVRTEAPADGTAWVGSIAGPGADVSCTARDPIVHELVRQTRYLCCAMTFDGRQTTDANYRFAGSGASQLPAGARVVVTEVGLNRINFRAESDGRTYTLYFEHGVGQTDAETYFERILRKNEPSIGLSDLPPSAAEAASVSRLVAGMTREQAILARGYPPLHHTPDLDAAEWLYYDAPGEGVYVTFADGVIKAVRRGSAP